VGPKKDTALRGTTRIHAGKGVRGGKAKAAKEAADLTMPSFLDTSLDYQTNDPDEMIQGKTEHAVHITYTMVCTTHKVISPRLRAAISEAEDLSTLDLGTIEKIATVLNNRAARTHLVTLTSIAYREFTTHERVWRDPRGDRERIKKKIYAAYSLKKMANDGVFK
jgi:hypothetical protein